MCVCDCVCVCGWVCVCEGGVVGFTVKHFQSIPSCASVPCKVTRPACLQASLMTCEVIPHSVITP